MLRTHDCVEAAILTKDHAAQLSRFLSASSVTLEQLAFDQFSDKRRPQQTAKETTSGSQKIAMDIPFAISTNYCQV